MKRESALSRRLKDIEREITALDRDVKSLAKVAKKTGSEPVPARPAAAPAPASAPQAPEPPMPAPPPPNLRHSDELFPARTAASHMPSRGPLPPDDDAAAPDRERGRVGGDRRFASYFVSGNMDSIRPLRQERSVQRNKAIAMLVFVVLVLLWVLYLVF